MTDRSTRLTWLSYANAREAGKTTRGAQRSAPCSDPPHLVGLTGLHMKFWRTNPKLLRKIKRRQAIASKMPQTKAEARKACFEAAQQHRITKLSEWQASRDKAWAAI